MKLGWEMTTRGKDKRPPGHEDCTVHDNRELASQRTSRLGSIHEGKEDHNEFLCVMGGERPHGFSGAEVDASKVIRRYNAQGLICG